VDKWDPEYWFLGVDGKSQLERNIAESLKISDNQLLKGRFQGWEKLNRGSNGQPDGSDASDELAESDEQTDEQAEKGSDAWGMPNPEEHLLKPYTKDNEVKALIDGVNYMDDLYDELKKLTPPLYWSQRRTTESFVLIAGWEFTGKDNVHAKLDGQVGSELDAVLTDLIAKGTKVRLLAFDNPLRLFGVVKNNILVDKLNKADKGCAFLDGILPGKIAAYHEKLVFLGKCSNDSSESWAYVGGIDLALDRRDSNDHKKTEKESTFYAWHDVQLKIRGPATTQIWADFAERWNGHRKNWPEKGLAPCPVTNWDEDALVVGEDKYVQVLRTVPRAPTSYPDRYMRNGERTVLCGLAKAISRAERYIYIEDQYLWDCELADFIRKRMCVEEELRLIVLLPGICELPGALGKYHDHLRSKFFMTVMGVNSKDQIEFGDKRRVYAYELHQAHETVMYPRPIYVHSKLIIIDDRYVAIGSANVDQRSMSVDTELHIAIVDGDTVDVTWSGNKTKVCKFAKELRESLWREHLGLYMLPTDPLNALNSFPRLEKRAKNSEHHVKVYRNRKGSDKLSEHWKLLLDRSDPRFKHFGRLVPRVPIDLSDFSYDESPSPPSSSPSSPSTIRIHRVDGASGSSSSEEDE
jgi:phosphatidylserine/phosphatidylglycerophosphate/cardiolipin synthase-like enzyme